MSKLMDQQKGRHDKTRRKTSQEEAGRDTEQKKKQSQRSDDQLVGQAKDDTRDQKEGRDEGLKNNNYKTKTRGHKSKTKLEHNVIISRRHRG